MLGPRVGEDRIIIIYNPIFHSLTREYRLTYWSQEYVGYDNMGGRGRSREIVSKRHKCHNVIMN